MRLISLYILTTFEVFLGGYGQSNYRIVWDGDALQYQMDDFAPPDGHSDPAERIEPSKTVWRQFWREMDAIGLWE